MYKRHYWNYHVLLFNSLKICYQFLKRVCKRQTGICISIQLFLRFATPPFFMASQSWKLQAVWIKSLWVSSLESKKNKCLGEKVILEIRSVERSWHIAKQCSLIGCSCHFIISYKGIKNYILAMAVKTRLLKNKSSWKPFDQFIQQLGKILIHCTLILLVNRSSNNLAEDW